VAEEASRLKQQLGKDILLFGSGYLVNALMRHDLIDELPAHDLSHSRGEQETPV
jgi:dihydrofolate reductase